MTITNTLKSENIAVVGFPIICQRPKTSVTYKQIIRRYYNGRIKAVYDISIGIHLILNPNVSQLSGSFQLIQIRLS